MTIRIPSPNLADRFLRLIGKKRAVRLPTNMGKLGQYYHVVGIKESFWKAFIRPKNRTLPEGTVNVFLVEDLKE
jgi:hypothetical protein